VFIAEGPVAEIGVDAIETLREAARRSAKHRARINMHAESDDLLHEMIIAIDRDSYIRPHRHPGKSESFHIVDGAVDVVIFDDTGEITRVVSLSADPRQGNFYYRMSQALFHTLIIRTEQLIVHEVTNGPFRPDGTDFAGFAPPDIAPDAAAAYMEELTRRVAVFRGARS
jgi:cupin fold WbuC family metalloprotein